MIDYRKEVTLDEMVERLPVERRGHRPECARCSVRRRGWTSKKRPHIYWSLVGQIFRGGYEPCLMANSISVQKS